ncbi:MAG TPA: prenyltransferase/squalene oxidase repeat-containing protein [Anaerolineaceae bacterium]|nr:prenyltransferase/squalene oxidase repeat-containing protein [Anaerolineaceae bacterium]
MDTWLKPLKFDPLPVLLNSGDEAVQYFARRDLLGKPVGSLSRIWQLCAPQKILKKQWADGFWSHPGEKKHLAVHYPLIETWKQFRVLVEQYGFTRQHPQIQKAAEFLFTCQTEEGDFRGFLANQYATYYTGAILSLLIQAGYGEDPRVEKGFGWLLSMRQADGGWTIPLLTHPFDRKTIYRLTSQYAHPVEPDRSKPFSHNWTGMVLRAFAVHPIYRFSEAAWVAACLLKSRFFHPDCYSAYQAASYWVRFDYPFWWNNLVAALDSISLIGLSREDEQIAEGLSWLVDHQDDGGLWKVSYAKPLEEEKQTSKTMSQKLWVTLAICRVLKRFYHP